MFLLNLLLIRSFFHLFPPPQEKLFSSRRHRRRSAPSPMASRPWRCGGSQPPAGGRDPVLILVRFSVLVGAMWRRRCPLVGIMSPTFYPRSDGVSSIVGGRADVCLCRISRDSVEAGLRWICLDPVFVRLRSGVYRFDPSDLRLSSSAMVATLVRWSYGTLARRLPDSLLQQGLSGSGEGGAMTAARLRPAPVLVVVTRWSTDVVVIFITSVVLCTAMIEDE